MLNKEVALKIKQIREERKITMEAFYFDTGIHIARIEQGKANITINTLSKICAYANQELKKEYKKKEIPFG